MKLKGLKNAWLNPKGEVITDAPGFYAGNAWHEGLAGYIVMDLQRLRTPQEAHEFATKDTPHAYTYQYLESIGWIRLCGWGKLILKWVLPCETVLTTEQKAVIARWCSENNVAWDKAFDVCGRDCCPIPINDVSTITTDKEKAVA